MFDLWAQTRDACTLYLQYPGPARERTAYSFEKRRSGGACFAARNRWSLIGTVDVQQWQGRTRVQIMIEEMKEWN